MSRKQDVVVIGGGPGGLVVASVAAQLGLRVTLIEKSDRLGGDCLHSGCIPSKTLIHTARVVHLLRHAPRYGLSAANPTIDMDRVIDRIDSVIEQLQQHDDPQRFRGYGCEVLFGAARFSGPREVMVDGTAIRARRIVIATGSQPLIPPIPNLPETGFETNETIFKRRELPPRLAVIGGGPVGLELAQAFARLGSKVTVIEAGERILLQEDAEVSASLVRVLQDEGIVLHTGVQATRVRRDGDSRQVALSSGATVECERILVAAGRQPDVHGLDLEQAGVDYTPRGIVVDRRLRTSQRHVHAIGDVCGPLQFTHMAEYQAGVVLANLLFRIPRKVDYRVVPRVIFTDPEVAFVGLSETEAKHRGLRYDVAQFAVQDIDRAATEGRGEGLIRILVVKGKVAGASLVAPHAGELIHELALAMQVNARVRTISELIHAYPTWSQLHRRAVNARYSGVLFSGKARLLAWLLNRILP